MRERILVFGTGSVAERLLDIIDVDKVEILAFINTRTTATSFHGYDIIDIDRLNEYEYDYILIASGYTIPIRKLLDDSGIADDTIISYIYDDDSILMELSEHINRELAEKYNRNKLGEWLKEDAHIPDFAATVLWDERRCLDSVYKDYVREQTVKLLYEVMKNNGISGAVAELGVFRGDFTVVLNRIFGDARMYLFDTFEGFNSDDIEADNTIQNKQGENEKFKDTSVEFVLSRLENTENVTIKQGYFPKTFDLYQESFMFVSIDLNIMKPTRDALDVFWPRMTRGGYILVSCYFAPLYEGTRITVDEWCREHGVTPVPIADLYGSVLIVKQ